MQQPRLPATLLHRALEAAYEARAYLSARWSSATRASTRLGDVKTCTTHMLGGIVRSRMRSRGRLATASSSLATRHSWRTTGPCATRCATPTRRMLSTRRQDRWNLDRRLAFDPVNSMPYAVGDGPHRDRGHSQWHSLQSCRGGQPGATVSTLASFGDSVVRLTSSLSRTIPKAIRIVGLAALARGMACAFPKSISSCRQTFRGREMSHNLAILPSGRALLRWAARRIPLRSFRGCRTTSPSGMTAST